MFTDLANLTDHILFVIIRLCTCRCLCNMLTSLARSIILLTDESQSSSCFMSFILNVSIHAHLLVKPIQSSSLMSSFSETLGSKVCDFDLKYRCETSLLNLKRTCSAGVFLGRTGAANWWLVTTTTRSSFYHIEILMDTTDLLYVINTSIYQVVSWINA